MSRFRSDFPGRVVLATRKSWRCHWPSAPHASLGGRRYDALNKDRQPVTAVHFRWMPPQLPVAQFVWRDLLQEFSLQSARTQALDADDC